MPFFFSPSGMKQLSFFVLECHCGNIAVVSKVMNVASRRRKLWIGYMSCWGAVKTLAPRWLANKRSSCLKNFWRIMLLKTSRENGVRKTLKTMVTCTGKPSRGGVWEGWVGLVRVYWNFLMWKNLPCPLKGCYSLGFVEWRSECVVTIKPISMFLGSIEHPIVQSFVAVTFQ